jgi:hypothetical protein
MNSTVSAILSEKHGITAHPGAKVECPFCQHQTFSIKKDDTIGKCFHPSCGRYIAPYQSEFGRGNILYKILDEIFNDMHKALLDLDKAEYPNAYGYCVKERYIHPRVLADSMLGAIPSSYDLSSRFAPYIEKAEADVKAETEKKKGKGRPRKSKGYTPQDQLDFLVEARTKLSKCIQRHAGWLAFFYTDAKHRIVSIRFRKPFTKLIVYFKPTRIAGVFNHSLFTPYISDSMKDFNDLLIVTEGEFNQLQLQSLCLRKAEKDGIPSERGYVFACAVGGVNNADVKTIQRLARTPVVCYDNDVSEAGFALVESLLEKVSVTAFTTPVPDSDIDDFIRGFESDIDKAYKAVKNIISGRKLFLRPYNALKSEIDQIRQQEGGKDGLKSFEVHRESAEIILSDLKKRGRFYYDGRISYFFFETNKNLMVIDRDNQGLELVLIKYGVAPSEILFRYVIDALRLEAMENGQLTEVHSFTYYDRSSNNLYVFNFGQQVYRITADRIEQVDNGTDGVLFQHNPTWTPFKTGEPDSGRSAFDDIILSQMAFREDGLTIKERRLLFLIWFYSLFFPELFPTKPILAVIGERGSGKTFALRKVGQLLFGPSFNVMQLSNDPKDFDAAVTNAPFVAVDNSDTKISWLDDRLAVVATGGNIKRRELYTTNRLVEFPVKAFLGITSRTPHFRREDVADRLLLFYVLRFETFVPESQLSADLLDNRDRIITEIIGHLQEIVKCLGDQENDTYSSGFRMADFANFALKIAYCQGWGDHMNSILRKLADEQTSFTIEGEPIFDLLDIWLAKDNGKNVGRELTSADLCRELAGIAEVNEIEFWYKDKTRAFAQRLRNLKSSLQTCFETSERNGGGRKRFLSFWPKNSKVRPNNGA